MEAAAAWDGACQFQLANDWTTVEEPAAGFPVEYASIDIPGSCGLQSYEYDDVQLQQHLVEYYSAASQHNIIATSEKAEMSNDDDSDDKVMDEFHAEMSIMKKKMHRYPACLGDIDKSYIEPRIVALGPYHRDLKHLKEAEEVKHVAACHCTREGQSVKEMRGEFNVGVSDVRRFYDKDAIAGISDDEFQHMMFFDACFLVQFMALWCRNRRRLVQKKDVTSLKRFMRPKRDDIFHDVMLLENQLPWSVVDKVLMLMNSSWISKEFVAGWRYCMMPYHYREGPPRKPFIWYQDYTPSHLLDLLRHYIVGRRTDIDGNHHVKTGANKGPKNMSFSVSAKDLAEIGITLKANESLELIDMRLNPKGFPELCLAPLSLDRDSASYLINMAALELCTLESFRAGTEADSAVCSYLLLLANLVCREEEVQELRERHLLQRGGGLTNAEVLAFLSCFQVVRMGPLFYRIMAGIEEYRDKSPVKTQLQAFVHIHKKTIAKVVTGVGALLGIIATLVSIKKAI